MGLYDMDRVMFLHKLHEGVEVGLGGEQFVERKTGGAG